MKFQGLCLFVLLSSSLAVQAQITPTKESDENLDKAVQAIEKQIQAKYKEIQAKYEEIQGLHDQIDELRTRQDPFLGERQRRAFRQWEIDYKKRFDTVEIRGKLTKSGD